MEDLDFSSAIVKKAAKSAAQKLEHKHRPFASSTSLSTSGPNAGTGARTISAPTPHAYPLTPSHKKLVQHLSRVLFEVNVQKFLAGQANDELYERDVDEFGESARIAKIQECAKETTSLQAAVPKLEESIKALFDKFGHQVRGHFAEFKINGIDRMDARFTQTEENIEALKAFYMFLADEMFWVRHFAERKFAHLESFAPPPGGKRGDDPVLFGANNPRDLAATAAAGAAVDFRDPYADLDTKMPPQFDELYVSTKAQKDKFDDKMIEWEKVKEEFRGVFDRNKKNAVSELFAVLQSARKDVSGNIATLDHAMGSFNTNFKRVRQPMAAAPVHVPVEETSLF